MAEQKNERVDKITEPSAALRRLPAVGIFLDSWRKASERAKAAPNAVLSRIARKTIDRARSAVIGAKEPIAPTIERLVGEADEELLRWQTDSGTCRVVNATGVILHSGLGRAVLAQEVAEAVGRLAGYCLLEVDREEGARRKRDAFCEELICELTGAEAALVVNNNAAATMIVLNTLAAGKNVLVSRSQLIEIGGSFRLPDVMEMSGCKLKEVGTTNRSYPSDYERAIDADTAALMLVHTSNYRLVGFTEHVGIDAMVALGRKRNLPVFHDLGSGSILSVDFLGVGDEPPVQSSVKSGADLICFSGDKMIGGPQAGIVVGKREWVERCRKNPLARALRIDKLTCVALETTLKLYFDPDSLCDKIPTLRMMRIEKNVLADHAAGLRSEIERTIGDRASARLVDDTSEMGAGSLPAIGLPTVCVAVRPQRGAVDRIAKSLRMRRIPIFSRVRDGEIIFDPRTLLPGDADLLVTALKECLEGSVA